MAGPLTDKQARFVDEYMVDINATQAAIRAGYSAKTAADIGRQLLRKTPVAGAIAERQRALSDRTGVTAERVIEELAKIGFSDIRKAVRWGSQPVDADAPPEEMMEDQPHGGALRRSRKDAANVVELVSSDEIDGETAAAIAEVSQTASGIKIKLHDKRAALVDLGRHLGLFKEKVEITGKDGGPVEVDEVSARDIISSRIARIASRSRSGGSSGGDDGSAAS